MNVHIYVQQHLQSLDKKSILTNAHNKRTTSDLDECSHFDFEPFTSISTIRKDHAYEIFIYPVNGIPCILMRSFYMKKSLYESKI